MTRLQSHRARSVLALAAVVMQVALPGCAGNVEGEVDGEALPPLLSSAWAANDDETGLVIALASHLDVCGVNVRRMQAYADAIEELDEKADLDDYYDALDDVDAVTAPGEDYWTLTVTLAMDDLDDVENESFRTRDGVANLSVCHQAGLPKRDNAGRDDNAECFFAERADIDVGAFAADGNLELTGDADLVDEELDPEGDIELSASASPCPELTDAAEDFVDATQDFLRDRDGVDDGDGDDEPGDGIGPDPLPPPSEGEGEGDEPAPEDVCFEDTDCLAGGELCDGELEQCAAPEDVVARCDAAFEFTSREREFGGPVLFDAEFERDSTSDELCDFGAAYFVFAEYFDAEGDVGLTTVGNDVAMSLATSSGFDVAPGEPASAIDGQFVGGLVCAESEIDDLALLIRDDDGNASNVACAGAI